MAKKRALGRGLDSLLKVREDEATSPVTSLPLGRLRPNPNQPRTHFDSDELASLAQSIEEQGIIQPLLVTPDDEGKGYVIIAGERRWRAARKAGIARVPVVVREADAGEQLEIALVENLQRADLDPIEEAEAYAALQSRFGLSQEQIARKVGKSRAAVANTTRLLKLSPEVKKLLRSGELKPGQARPLLAIADPQEQLRLARRAAGGELTARDLEGRAAERKRPRRAAPPLDADTVAAAERLTRRLQTRVNIRRRGKGGAVTIAFHSEEELMRLYELLMKAAGSSR